jgi:hypothetical protein
MRDEKGQDDKIIAVHVDDPEYATTRTSRGCPRTGSRSWSASSWTTRCSRTRSSTSRSRRGRPRPSR